MKKILASLFLVLSSLLIFSAQALAMAGIQQQGGGNGSGTSPGGGNSAIADACAKAGSDSILCQRANDTLASYVPSVVNWLMFAVGAASVIFVIIGGIRYATSSGDPAKLKSAKRTILGAIIGLAIALLSLGIVQLVNKWSSGGRLINSGSSTKSVSHSGNPKFGS